MGKLTNALQGKLNSGGGMFKGPAERQLDLFSSLADRGHSTPKITLAPPEHAPARSEPEMVLPPSGTPPPDVAADVRAVLSESGQARAADARKSGGEARPPLRTGIYHRPRREAVPPPERTDPPARGPADRWKASGKALRDWLAGGEMDRRMISLLAVSLLLVALIGFWAGCPRQGEEPVVPAGAEEEVLPVAETELSAPAPASAESAAEPASPDPVAAPAPTVSASSSALGWKIAGTVATENGGAVMLRFSDPLFVSAANISIEGMRALKAVAAKLVEMKAPARVVVTGYTDNEPLSKPTARFKSNADIAAARAKTAADHLAQFARANPGLAFEVVTGDPAQAPYPNDTPQNRRLNRTATVQILPAGN